MHRFFVDKKDVKGDLVYLAGDQADHLTKVLRHKPGDLVEVCANDGVDCTCRIESITREQVSLTVLSREPNLGELPYSVTLYQALPKGDKLELITQKLSELGVARLVPMVTARVVSVPKKQHKLERLRRIAAESAKQCKRGRIMEIGEIVSFDQALEAAAKESLLLLPYEQERTVTLKSVLRGMRPPQSIAVFIGSEGGFEPWEAESAKATGAKLTTLGNTILRCETAGLVTVAMINYEFNLGEFL